jgi:DNA modification methylase
LKYIPFANIIWDKNGQSSNRCAWGSWMQPSSPSFPMTFEHILIFCKESLKLQHKGVTDITREEFITYTNSLWKMTPQTNMKKKYNHGAMFPEELPYRCIKMLSYVGDVVLDCFNGAGTTTFVANKLNRKYIGFELSEKYCATAQERIDKYNKEKEI